eukprot:345961-Pleurochrysis_carterae.AAC.1
MESAAGGRRYPYPFRQGEGRRGRMEKLHKHFYQRYILRSHLSDYGLKTGLCDVKLTDYNQMRLPIEIAPHNLSAKFGCYCLSNT